MLILDCKLTLHRSIEDPSYDVHVCKSGREFFVLKFQSGKPTNKNRVWEHYEVVIKVYQFYTKNVLKNVLKKLISWYRYS